MIKHHYAFEAICKMKKFDLDQTREAISRVSLAMPQN